MSAGPAPALVRPWPWPPPPAARAAAVAPIMGFCGGACTGFAALAEGLVRIARRLSSVERLLATPSLVERPHATTSLMAIGLDQ